MYSKTCFNFSLLHDELFKSGVVISQISFQCTTSSASSVFGPKLIKLVKPYLVQKDFFKLLAQQQIILFEIAAKTNSENKRVTLTALI